MTAIFYTILEKENDTGEIDHIPMLKTFVVFNVEQIDGLSLTADTVAPQATFDALPQAENLFCNSGANIIEKGQNAFLNREMKGRFSSENYAFEELIAELGSVFLMADLGIVG